MERKRGCKIRKRGGSSSSSSSSSLARQNRFKRAIFAGKRATVQDNGGLGTPVKSISAAKTPVLLSFSPENHPTDQTQRTSISARKLAATLWEISDSSDPPPVSSHRDFLGSKKPSKNRTKKSTKISSHDFPPKTEREDIVQRRTKVSQKQELIEYKNIVTNSVKTRFKIISDGLTTSKELAKVLKRINDLGDDHKTASNRLISALIHEVDRARSSLKHLIIEIETEEFQEEEEATRERKLQRETEKMNIRLRRDLKEAKEREKKMREEMEREKRAKDVLEEVCDELARGIGDDKREMEKEREMMRIADVLREERVQMKLMEAKNDFEEKHAAVEMIKNELRRVFDGREIKMSPEIRRILDGSDDDDEESELKSIELNMESGSKWGYVDDDDDDDDDGDDDGDGDDVEKRLSSSSVVVDNGERDECLKNLRDYIVSNVSFIGSSSSEMWNHRKFPSSEFV
ncbi:unnamed protein product [Cochlearia groenlandica]